MDDGLIIAQNKFIDILNAHLFYSYNVLSKLLINFGLVIEHGKTEVFHFNRLHEIFNPPPLDLSLLGGIRHSSHLRMKVCGVGSDMHRV